MAAGHNRKHRVGKIKRLWRKHRRAFYWLQSIPLAFTILIYVISIGQNNDGELCRYVGEGEFHLLEVAGEPCVPTLFLFGMLAAIYAAVFVLVFAVPTLLLLFTKEEDNQE